MRGIRTTMLLAALLCAAASTQLLAPGAAAAATTCKQYDQFPATGSIVRNVRVCAAPASDYPSHTGWGRIADPFVVHDICGGGFLPPDYDDPIPAIACAPRSPHSVSSWAWTASGWNAGGGSELQHLTAVWTAPYAPGWRWVWTQASGWRAVQEQSVAFRWYA